MAIAAVELESVPQDRREGFVPIAGWHKMLDDAEYLLGYASHAGVQIDSATIQSIVSADKKNRMSDEDTTRIILAVTNLATKLKPVTAETLRAGGDEAQKAIRRYRLTAMILAAIIIPASIFSYITTGLSNSINTDIAHANQLAVTLNQEFGPPAATSPTQSVGVKELTELQDFAATIREIDDLSRQLRPLVFGISLPPQRNLELNVPVTDPISEIIQKTQALQEVRAFAKDMQQRVTLLYGAFGNCILPSLYAILGACAYLIRSVSDQVVARTFKLTVANTARFIVAAIGGGVVGLFSTFTVGQGATLSPLAIAFLVGYATDIFFSFLDGLQQSFTKAKPA